MGACLFGVLTALVVLSGCSASGGDGPRRILLLGDSITQGKAGDRTWRYDLWKDLQDEKAQVDFVGPSEELQSGSLDYADPGFDRDHAAVWGAPLTPPPYDPTMLGKVYRPDVAVIELGVNDLLSQHETPAAVAASMGDTIEQLRQAAPGVDVVLVHVPATSIDGVPELNARYDALALSLDSPEERVVVAEADTGFVSDPAAAGTDSYDGLHPNAAGEEKIADAVASALSEVGVGSVG